MMHYLVFLLVPISAVLWRMGGGAFTAETALNAGTDGARVFRALTAGAFGLAVWWWGGLAVAALFAGLLLTGWGPFQGMGLPSPHQPEKSWLRALPLALGLPVGTLAHDFVGMAEAGVICLAPLAVTMFGLSGWHWPHLALFIVAGLLFGPAYLLARRDGTAIPRFATGQEWGEVFAGAVVGLAIALSLTMIGV